MQSEKQKETKADRKAAFRKANACFFWKPYPWQLRLLEAVRKKTITAAISSNKIGKSACIVNILISWLLGFEPWNVVDKDDPEAVLAPGGFEYLRRSSLGIDPPVDLILTGEDWKSHIGGTLVPELKKWAPEGWYKTKKNEQGVEYKWDWNNKSSLTIMCYSQDDDLFESFRKQGVAFDEPPPRSKYSAMSRGLLLDGGKTLFSLTPLKEAWILDEIVLSGRRDIAIVDNLKITDNPDLYGWDLNVLKDMGLSEAQSQEFFDLLLYENKERERPVEDKGAKAEKYLEKVVNNLDKISELKILKFIKDIDPADVPPRVFGQFKSLVGRVLKGFEDDIHVIEPFDIPTDWPVVPMIDFHLNVPQAVSYWTVNPQGINYCIGEFWDNTDGGGISDDIIRKTKRFGWDITDAYIDPLSKGDTAYMKNRYGSDLQDTFSIIEGKLSSHGITLHVASKDKESGIRNIQTWLFGPNKLPTMYVFSNCARFLYEVKRWVFDDDGKPIKENDHMMENAYRYTLVGNAYESHKINPLPQVRPKVAGSWMGL